MDKKYIKFIEKVKNIHGDSIDLTKVEYVDSKTKVCLICHEKDENGVEHGEYWQTPANCIRGQKCPKCANKKRGPSNEKRMTTDKFILEANKVHNNKYDYSQTTYINTNTKVDIICQKHGLFCQLPYAHLSGQGCPKCNGKDFTSEEIIERFKEIHGNKYQYDKVVFVKMKEKVCITCPKHGDFYQTPQKHINGQGCPICSGRAKSNSEEFKEKANIVHNYKYIYDKVEYVNNKTKVCITCPKHGEFYEIPDNHLKGHGCRKCGCVSSKGEKEIIKFLSPFECEEHNHSIANGKEIDIYIPSLKLGIEYDGLRWHSEQFVQNNNYHLEKTNECADKGIRLIHIFEDEWIYKNEIVKSRLLNIIGKTPNKIYGRKCEIKFVANDVTRDFLNENHIQGYCNSSIRYGLYYNGELVSLMTFGKLRKNLGSESCDGHYELLRFCNKLNTTVIGGASKLFKFFLKTHHPSEVISYADRRWSFGNMYEKLGFTLSHISQPNYFYVIGNERENRFKYRKDVLVSEGYDESKSEHQIMLERGIYRIYDCGCLVYKYKK